jgi:outer membrane protein assembly factor BamD (BamD/ComL family)
LEPGLEQYFILFEGGSGHGEMWLDVAAECERTGARTRAKRIYERVLENAGVVETAERAFEGLARMLLVQLRQGEIKTVWESLSRRFPDAKCTAPEIKALLDESPADRIQRGKAYLDELARTTNQLRALQLCRSFDTLWTPEEATRQWRAVVDRAEAGTLGEQLSRVFLARAMLETGTPDVAEAVLRGLTESVNPSVRARSLALLAQIAQAAGRAEESLRLHSKVVQIERPTAVPSWCPGFLRIHCSGEGTRESGCPAQGLYLEACNNLLDGDYPSAVDALCRVAADPSALPEPLRPTLSLVMMLAYLGSEDCAAADRWGYTALGEWSRNTPEDARLREHLAKAQSLDVALGQLTMKVRMERATPSDASSEFLADAKALCKAAAALDSPGASAERPAEGIRQLHSRAKRFHLAQVLTAEYGYVKQRLMDCEAKEPSSAVESLLFAAQLIGEDSFDRVRENLSLACDAKEVGHVMYRFAAFARETGRPDVTRQALDTAASGLSASGNADMLEDIAGMYLAASSHQKAIDIYERVAAATADSSRIQSVLRKIIDIHGEDMKDYETAIRQCEEFARKYPDSPRAREVEFLIGKYAYLRKDYSGSAGQLDGFRKRWPEDPLAGQAMLLAGLARMAEGNNPDAIGRFTEIIQRYPDGELAARSKFLIGYSQVSSQQYQAALETFKQMIEQFPHSQYTSQAQSLIDRLSKVAK